MMERSLHNKDKMHYNLLDTCWNDAWMDMRKVYIYIIPDALNKQYYVDFGIKGWLTLT